jgi:hypothetical protein
MYRALCGLQFEAIGIAEAMGIAGALKAIGIAEAYAGAVKLLYISDSDRYMF